MSTLGKRSCRLGESSNGAMDEPSILMVDDPNIHDSLQYFSDAATLIEKRTRVTYQSSGS